MDYVACTRPSRSMWCAERPQEIVDWIRDHNRRNGGSRLTNYVAIDDRVLPNELGGEYMRGHFVQTRMANGLTAERAQEAVRILNGPPAPIRLSFPMRLLCRFLVDGRVRVQVVSSVRWNACNPLN